jgi:hypothetical protein
VCSNPRLDHPTQNNNFTTFNHALDKIPQQILRMNNTPQDLAQTDLKKKD